MTFTQTALRDTAALAAAIRAMPFNRALADGTLPHPIFRHYIIQDAHYLEGFARALAGAAARAPDAEAVAQLAGSGAGAIAVERQLHSHFMGLYGVDTESFAATPPSPACCHYVSYLLATAATRSIAETVAALLPCFWVYRDVGHAIHAVAAPDNPYGRRDVWRAGVSVRAIAAGQSPFHGRPFVRNGMTRVAWRSMMAVWQRRLWQRRVSQAPSAVTAPIASPSGIWVSRAGSTGRLPVAAGGEFHRPDARRGVLHGQMRLAP